MEVMEIDSDSVEQSHSEHSQPQATSKKINNPTDTLPWVEKYRPKTLDELISHDHIIATLKKLIDSNKLPHLLLYGPPGTGKTSTVLACARMMNNGANIQSMTLELNASDERSIDVVRDRIKDFASTRQMFGEGVKLVILDEADAMLNDAQAALRRVIEKYTSTTRFCLIANHVNKISPAIQSRCTRFRFGPLSNTQIRSRLDYVIKQEGVKATEDGIKALLTLGNGDMRKVLNNLQATYMSYGIVNDNNVYMCTGHPKPTDIRNMITWMFNLEFEEAYEKTQRVALEKGLALGDILQEVHKHLTLMKLHDNVVLELYSKLADIEYRITKGATESIQLSAMVAAFQSVRDEIVID